jgi:6-pyruvoyltetrahydropterin/6-carboxytetrahydropterin synthase
MKAYLTRRYHFSASHRLDNPELTAEQNRSTYGKCNNPYGHGHNYALEVTVSGQVNPETGMVCNLVELDGFVGREILERYAHANLNTLSEFHRQVPTTENLCVAVYSKLSSGFNLAKVENIRIGETMMNSFEYAGGRDLRY